MPDIGDRRLATIRRVSKVEPIPGADRIVKITVDGWELVTQKDNNFQPGTLVLYFEVDSFLPVREEFEFLRKGCFKSTTNLGDGFRIKTIKLKGQVSQGLSLPLSDFFEKDEGGYWYYRDETEDERAQLERREWVDTKTYLEEGMDVTDYFKVQKYEKPLVGPGGSKLGPVNMRGHFPSFLQKTDQERAQNCLGGVLKWIYFGEPTVTEVTSTELIEALEANTGPFGTEDSFYFKSGDMWFHKHWLRNDEETIAERQKFEVTLKMDGSSMTVYHNDYTYGVCSRNYDLKRDEESVFWQTALHNGIITSLVSTGRNVAVQGELMGPGVQGNREEFEWHGLWVFDVYDIDAGRYMTPVERDEFMDTFGILHVPTIDFSFSLSEETTVQSLLEMADRASVNHNVAEGLVFKSHQVGGPSFKIINNKFLLAEKD